MLKKFGENVKRLRVKQGLTLEAFCQDESELSMRQLTRIEKGQSTPTLNKITYIAQRLGVSVGSLTDGQEVELPERYRHLKYLLLRTPTYGDQAKLREREAYFDEIFVSFYETLPEEEQLIIDCLQSKLDIHFSEDINFGMGILNDYFDQILLKSIYNLNDLIIIDLYLSCLTIAGLANNSFKKHAYEKIMASLLEQPDYLPLEELFVLNNVLLNNFELLFSLKNLEMIEELMDVVNDIMVKTQDFQKKPILAVLEWKYYLRVKEDLTQAETSYQSALVFANLIQNSLLEERLHQEWAQDVKK